MDQIHHRHDVAGEIEIEFFVNERAEHVHRGDVQEGVAVGRGGRDRLGAEIGAGAGLVLDKNRLADPVGQRLGNEPRRDIRRAAGGEADDHAYRPCRIIERRRDARQRRRHRRARCQMQKFPARKHGAVSPYSTLILASLMIGPHNAASP